MASHIKDLDDLNDKLDEAGAKLVVIDFHATWCGPCKVIAPKIDQMSKEFSDVIFLKVDVDECEDIATEYDIQSMPTFLFLKNREKVDSFSGANPDKLRNLIVKYR